jgi:hypothetical protein
MSNSKRRSPTIVWRDAVRDSGLDGTAKAVAYTLSTYMNGKAEAFPSKATLAAGASVCNRAADRAILRLESNGFLRVARTRGRKSNHYYGVHPTPYPGTGLTPYGETGLETANPVRKNTPTPYETTSNPVPSDPLSSYEIEKEIGAALCARCNAAPPAHEDAKLCADCARPVETEAKRAVFQGRAL